MYIPSFPIYMYVYILTKSEFISSCSRPAVGSNIVQITRATSLVNIYKKRPPAAILDVQKSLLIAFLTISDRYHNLNFVFFFYKMAAGGHFGSPKNRLRSHFWPFQIDRLFWMSEIHFRSHFWPFQIHTELNYQTRPRYLDEQCMCQV